MERGIEPNEETLDAAVDSGADPVRPPTAAPPDPTSGHRSKLPPPIRPLSSNTCGASSPPSR